jgi:CRP-like cAMP-binding protein
LSSAGGSARPRTITRHPVSALPATKNGDDVSKLGNGKRARLQVLYVRHRTEGVGYGTVTCRRIGAESCMAASPHQNHLLDALPVADYDRLTAHAELIPMSLGGVLYEPGVKLGHVYFPTTAIISLLYVMENGASAEIAVVGNEGILGISLFMGGDTTPSRAIVQSAGHGFRVKADLLKTEFARFGATMRLLLRYTQALITQMSQTAVCNRHHSIDQQLCRWLLLSMDRLSGNELNMTQELIGNMLGVRREGVTEAAGKLQDAGLIQYSRGRITVLDRKGLEERSCECYQVVKTETDRLLSYVRK